MEEQFELLSQYMDYWIRMNTLNHYPHWYERAKEFPNGLNWKSGKYYPVNDILVKSITEDGMPHPILTFEEWKKNKLI